MYCKYCGKLISDDKTVCPYCNRPVVKDAPNYNQGYNHGAYDAPSFGWAFVGFLIPLLGLILYLVWKPDYPQKAHSAGKGALVSVILSIVLSAILVGLVTCGTLAILSTPYYY